MKLSNKAQRFQCRERLEWDFYVEHVAGRSEH